MKSPAFDGAKDRMVDRIPSNATCTIIPLTIKLGPASGTTRVYCTCGWDRTYKTRRGAIRCAREHIKLTTPKEDA